MVWYDPPAEVLSTQVDAVPPLDPPACTSPTCAGPVSPGEQKPMPVMASFRRTVPATDRFSVSLSVRSSKRDVHLADVPRTTHVRLLHTPWRSRRCVNVESRMSPHWTGPISMTDGTSSRPA